MKMAFEHVDQLATGVWLSKVDADDLKGFATRSATSGNRSIVAVSGAQYDDESKLLTISPSGIEVLAIGSSGTAVIVEQSANDVPAMEKEDQVSEQEWERKPLLMKGTFAPFLEACLDEGLPREIVALASDILNEMRNLLPFTLTEGKARKWTADPNFVAITIQNRNKQLLVSVKGDHRRMAYSTISPVMGRGIAYSEFHLSSRNQFHDAIDAIRKSAGL